MPGTGRPVGRPRKNPIERPMPEPPAGPPPLLPSEQTTAPSVEPSTTASLFDGAKELIREVVAQTQPKKKIAASAPSPEKYPQNPDNFNLRKHADGLLENKGHRLSPWSRAERHLPCWSATCINCGSGVYAAWCRPNNSEVLFCHTVSGYAMQKRCSGQRSQELAELSENSGLRD